MGQLLFKKCFWDAIRSGDKRTTIRRWDRARFRAGQRVYSLGLGWLIIESIREVPDLATLEDDDAQADGFVSVAELRKALETIYPDARIDGKQWYLTRFRVEELLPIEGFAAKTEARRSRGAAKRKIDPTL